MELLRPDTICIAQKSYVLTLADNVTCHGAAEGCQTIITISPNVPGMILTLVSSSNVNSIVIAGNKVTFYCLNTPWFVNINIDISGTTLGYGDTFQIVVTTNPNGCGTPPLPTSPIFVDACSSLVPDPGYSIPLFSSCGCNKIEKSTIVSTTNEIFTPTAGRLFYKIQPKW